MLIFGKQCNHQWKVQTDKITESTFEHSIKVANSVARPGSSANLPHQLCCDTRKHILIMTCEKCGKVNKTITNLGD